MTSFQKKGEGVGGFAPPLLNAAASVKPLVFNALAATSAATDARLPCGRAGSGDVKTRRSVRRQETIADVTTRVALMSTGNVVAVRITCGKLGDGTEHGNDASGTGHPGGRGRRVGYTIGDDGVRPSDTRDWASHYWEAAVTPWEARKSLAWASWGRLASADFQAERKSEYCLRAESASPDCSLTRAMP